MNLKKCNCNEKEICTIPAKIQEAFALIKNEYMPISFLEKKKVLVDICKDLGYTSKTEIHEIDNGPWKITMREAIKLGCENFHDLSLEDIRNVLIRVYCSILDDDGDAYVNLHLDQEQIFKLGFEDGINGTCPKFSFETDFEDELYNEGYEKGQKAAIARALKLGFKA